MTFLSFIRSVNFQDFSEKSSGLFSFVLDDQDIDLVYELAHCAFKDANGKALRILAPIALL